MDQEIKFFCYEGDSGFTVTLEPEGMTYEVKEKNEIKFKAKNTNQEFYWSCRHESSGIQVFPDTPRGYSGVEVYKNGDIIDTF